jgi:hypothetical protein
LADLQGWLALNAGTLILVLIVLALALAGMVVWLVLRLRRLERHYEVLTTGTDGGNLAEILDAHMRQLHHAMNHVRALDDSVRRLESDACRHVQHLRLVRFNAFRDTGGDQSFVIALADGSGNGGVISTLHSRDATRIYGKPLTAWKSQYPLTDEEVEAIAEVRREA